MSADDTIYVQKNASGMYVAQYGSMSRDTPPDPETVTPAHQFKTLDALVNHTVLRAMETEYGFTFTFNPDAQDSKPKPEPLLIQEYKEQPERIEVVRATLENLQLIADWARASLSISTNNKDVTDVVLENLAGTLSFPLPKNKSREIARDRYGALTLLTTKQIHSDWKPVDDASTWSSHEDDKKK